MENFGGGYFRWKRKMKMEETVTRDFKRRGESLRGACATSSGHVESLEGCGVHNESLRRNGTNSYYTLIVNVTMAILVITVTKFVF